MQQVVFLIILFIIGACFGSFLCCQARRFHLREEKPKTKLNRRSVCLHCGYQLKWYDNLPIISWLFLKGKCRKCHKKIGGAEIMAELGVGLAFLTLGIGMHFNGITINTFISQTLLTNINIIMIFIFTLIVAFLAIYDGLYGQLPTLYLMIAIGWALIITVLSLINGAKLGDLVLSVAVLGGVYLLLYIISKGKWVGAGAWILGSALALVLGPPWLALVTLFLANFIACLTMLPVIKRLKNHKIYFGPFLVVAFVIVYSFSEYFYAIISLW